jgi:hypothetical protein
MWHDANMQLSATRIDASRPMLAKVVPGPIVLVPRRLDGYIADQLDATDPAALPHVRLSGGPTEIRHGLIEPMGRLAAVAPALAEWLLDDIVFLMRFYREATGAPRLSLRLETIEDDRCCSFHSDNVAFRLMTTYRGPGTEWVLPGDTEAVVDGHLTQAQAVRRLKRGEIAIMRGLKAAEQRLPAVLHRSPPIADCGELRLFLAINEARDAA